MTGSFDLREVTYWIKHYGHPGVSDRHAIQTYLECENDEKIRPFRLQLNSIVNGKVEEESLNKLVGIARKNSHGSYERWAKLMLQWLNVSKH